MLLSNRTHLFRAAFLSYLFIMGCQKATPRAVKMQVGYLGAQDKSAPLSEADKKIDEAMKSDKIVTCSAAFIKKQTELDALLASLNKKVSDNKDKNPDQALQTELANISLDLKTKSDAQIADLVTQSASGCKAQKTILIIDLKNKINTSLIAAADLIGQDNAASSIARQEKKRLDDIQANESLVTQSFSLTKDLALVLDENNLSQKVHFVAGKISRGQSDIDILADEKLRSFCVLTSAVQKKLSEEAKMTILDLKTSVQEKPIEAGSKKIVKTSTMTLKIAIEDELIGLECPLSKTAKISETEVEFKDIFGGLIKY